MLHTQIPEEWPSRFSDLQKSAPEGWLIVDSVQDPVLFVTRCNNTYVARLGAVIHKRSGPINLYAPSIDCDWVYGAGLIYPLPCDTREVVETVLPGIQPDSVTFPQVIELRRNVSEGVTVRFDPCIWQPATDEAESVDGLLDVPGLNASLYEYQAKGIQWMRRSLDRTGGAILADEMGLGKTIQIIGLLLIDPPGVETPALVVCPTTLIANWVRELAKFSPSLTVGVHRGPDRGRLPRHLQGAQVLITTYDTLVNDLVLFKSIPWSWLICDEAQAVKNPDARRRKAVAEIRAKRTIPVTGTPVENHLLDLWSLVDIAVPGLLGGEHRFRSSFPDSPEAARLLSETTNPIILRRCVQDVAQDLPERIDIEVPLELGASLAADYEAVRQETLAQYPQAGAMVATGQLQLFCAHPSLRMGESKAGSWEDLIGYSPAGRSPLLTPKLERTLDLLDEAFRSRKKVLLFANFNACDQILRSAATHLPSAYWGAINGSTPSSSRQQIVDEFTEYSGPAVLVLNPRAAGTGLNITAATVVIHFTQVWNPALELQASARAFRRGQTQPVTIYHMYYINTVEEIMLGRAQRRRQLGREAVPLTEDDQADLIRALTISPV